MNCGNNSNSTSKKLVRPLEKSVVKSRIDSVKYKQEIYRIDTLFQSLYQSNQFNGNVLVAKANEIIYQKAFGYAVKEKNEPLNDSTIFQLASVSKVITGIAVMQLYEKGQLKLNQLVCDILPDFPYKTISVQHLLSHRSGIPNYAYFCDVLLKNDPTVLSNNDMLDIIVKHKPICYLKTNTRFNYSNTNYALLALIVEKISGKTFSDYLKDELFIPLGMTHSFTAKNLPSDKKNKAQGYTHTFKPVANDRFDGILGDKGIYTSTYDLYLLSTSLYQKSSLSAQTQAMCYTPFSPEKKLGNYGLGWRMKNWTSTNKEVFHNGWWHGFRSAFHRRLNDSLTIIVLSNRLNKSVYATWRIYDAIDGTSSLEKMDTVEE